MMLATNFRLPRALLLVSIYTLGILGILASGGGGSGGSAVEATGIYVDQPDSPTLGSSIIVTGKIYVNRDPNSEYSVQVNYKYRNKLTGESGTGGVVISRKCSILPPPFFLPYCYTEGDGSFSIPMALGISSNEITVEVENMKKSVYVVRIDDTLPPRKPTGVSAYGIDNGAVVSWDSLLEATSYNIYFASSPGVTKSNYATLPDGGKLVGGSSPQSIIGLTVGKLYYFVVTGVNFNGEGQESAEQLALSLPSVAPDGVKGTTANGEVTVTWEPVDFAVSYNLYLATESGVNSTNYNALENGQKVSNVTSPHVISGLENETRYYIVIEVVSYLGDVTDSLELVLVPGTSGWEWQNPTPTGNVLWDVEFTDALNGWIVGNGGTVLSTIDGGNNWSSQWDGASIDFLSVSAVNTQNVWAMGTKGFITSDVGYILINTEDGGATWTFHAIPTGIEAILDIYFVSPLVGWMVGFDFVYFTNNGGSSWTLQSDVRSYRISAIDAVNAKFLAQNGDLYSTSDGGTTWDGLASFGSGTDIFFIDANNGWVLSSSGKYVTTDGGNTWNVSTGGTTNPLSISFSDLSNGWVVGYGGGIDHTNNAGATWSPQTAGTSQVLYSVFAINANTAWAVGSGGTILYTDDAGATWINRTVNTISMPDRLDAIDFVDGSNGWVVGRGGIARSSDGGSTWTVQATPINRSFWDVDFVDASTGWAVGSQRTLIGSSYINVAEVFHTSDGGNSWVEQDVGNCGTNCFYRAMNGVSFIDDQTGWAAGSGVFYTSDSGINWNRQNMPWGTGTLRDVQFINANIGWAVGDDGTIIHTIDGGMTWNPQTSGTSYTLYSVFALDSSTAWIAGGVANSNRPIILKTSDGGTTWQNINIDNYGKLFSIYFSDSMNGWAGGQFGEIFATQDGGDTWVKQSSNFSDSSGRISDIQFTDSSTGWATGWFGPTVLKSSTGGFGP